MENTGQKKLKHETEASKEKVSLELKRTKIKYLFEIIKRYDTSISQANAKASFLISISGILIVALISQYNNIFLHLACTKTYSILSHCVFFLSGLGFLISLILSLFVVYPLTSCGKIHGEYTSFIAYESVFQMRYEALNAKHSSEDYDFWSDILHQIHIVASILHNKYMLLKIASIITASSITALSVLFLIYCGVLK